MCAHSCSQKSTEPKHLFRAVTFPWDLSSHLSPSVPLSGFRPNEYKIMDRMKNNLKQANPNFHMQICLSQQSLSPSHHFLHSNAFSHLYKIPPSATRRGCARFADLQNRYFCTFDLFCEKVLCRCGVLHALICIFYYEE